MPITLFSKAVELVQKCFHLLLSHYYSSLILILYFLRQWDSEHFKRLRVSWGYGISIVTEWLILRKFNIFVEVRDTCFLLEEELVSSKRRQDRLTVQD